MKIYLHQFAPSAQVQENFDLLAQVFASQAEADLIVAPEVFLTGFAYRQLAVLAEKNRHYLAEIRQLCARHHKAFAGSFFWSEKGQNSNRAFFIDENGKISARYDKTHLIPAFREDEFLQAGKKGRLLGWRGLKIGLSICYDLRFPELYRRYARQEAELFLVISQWPASRRDHFLTLARARAIENQAYVALVNTSGLVGKIEMAGSSAVIDPWGNFVCQAEPGRGCLGELNLPALQQYRQEFPALYQYSRAKK